MDKNRKENIGLSQEEMAYERTELSEYRTDLAYQRTAMANSQTLLSYFRTAIATFAAGIGMFEFITNDTIVRIGIALMIVAPVIAIIGLIHYIKVRENIKRT